MRFPARFEHGKYDLYGDIYREIRPSEPQNTALQRAPQVDPAAEPSGGQNIALDFPRPDRCEVSHARGQHLGADFSHFQDPIHLLFTFLAEALTIFRFLYFYDQDIGPSGPQTPDPKAGPEISARNIRFLVPVDTA